MPSIDAGTFLSPLNDFQYRLYEAETIQNTYGLNTLAVNKDTPRDLEFWRVIMIYAPWYRVSDHTAESHSQPAGKD